MRKLKFNIIYLIGLLVLSCAIITTFAAFIFSQTASINAKLGDITIDSQNYLIYAKRNHGYTEEDEDFLKAEKLRNDTVAVIDNIQMDTETSYEKTNDQSVVSGKTYYTQSGTSPSYTYTPVSTPTASELNTYYEATISYNGIESATGYYYDESIAAKKDRFVNLTINVSDDNDTLSFTINSLNISVECTLSSGIVEKANVIANGKNYKAVIGVDGLNMVIIDTSITKTPTTGYTALPATGNIKCSATETKYYSEDDNSTKYYVSQIGFQFSFTSEIACYVRLRIKDAWTRTKDYSSSVSSEKYVIKDTVGGKSPFAVIDDDWYFDPLTNYIYLKKMYNPNETNENGVPIHKDSNGDFQAVTYTFGANEAYYYISNSTTAYDEYIDVDLSFDVQIVQANRIEKKWGITPSEFNKNN